MFLLKVLEILRKICVKGAILCWAVEEGTESKKILRYPVGVAGDKRGGVVSKNDTLVPFVKEKTCSIVCPPDTIETLCQCSLSMTKDSLFVLFRLFVTLRFPKQLYLLLCSWYHCKALISRGALNWFSQHFNVQWRSYWMLNNFFTKIHLNQN